MKLNEIFNITYGNKFDLNKMVIGNASEINFVGRTAKNNGIVAKVEPYLDIVPYPQGLITVALGGSILSSFVQTKPFYTAQNVAVLAPIEKMHTSELLYYCTCIEANKFKYSAFGREANVTLSTLEVPSRKEVPAEYRNFDIKKYASVILNKVAEKDSDNIEKTDIKLVPLKNVFKFENGITTTGIKVADKKNGKYSLPMIRPSYKQTTSIAGYVMKNTIPPDKIFNPETLYVSTNGQGSHTYSYVSAFEFTANSDVTVLKPIRTMSLKEKLYYAMIITSNRFRFSYGRKPKGDKLKSLLVPEYVDKEFLNLSIENIVERFSACIKEI